jgi:hypothetical protein
MSDLPSPLMSMARNRESWFGLVAVPFVLAKAKPVPFATQVRMPDQRKFG